MSDSSYIKTSTHANYKKLACKQQDEATFQIRRQIPRPSLSNAEYQFKGKEPKSARQGRMQSFNGKTKEKKCSVSKTPHKDVTTRANPQEAGEKKTEKQGIKTNVQRAQND